MADVFISYSKVRASAAALLAKRLGDIGYSVWWDTSLVPTGLFEEEINRQLDAAKAVIVVWSAESVRSKWVRSEAAHADRQDKLINTHLPGLDSVLQIPKPYDQIHSVLVHELPSIVRALDALKVPRSGRLPVVMPIHSFGTAEADDDRLFEEAERIGTSAAYDYYLSQLPDGRHAAQARSRLQEAPRRYAADPSAVGRARVDVKTADEEQRAWRPPSKGRGRDQKQSATPGMHWAWFGTGAALVFAMIYATAHYAGVKVPEPVPVAPVPTQLSPAAKADADKEKLEAAARKEQASFESNLATISQQVASRLQQLVLDAVDEPLKKLELCTAQWVQQREEGTEKSDRGPPYKRPNFPTYCYRHGLTKLDRTCLNGECTLRSKIEYDLSNPSFDIAIDATFGPFNVNTIQGGDIGNIAAKFEMTAGSSSKDPMNLVRKVMRLTDKSFYDCNEKRIDQLVYQKITFANLNKDQAGRYCTDYSVHFWSGLTRLADTDPLRLGR